MDDPDATTLLLMKGHDATSRVVHKNRGSSRVTIESIPRRLRGTNLASDERANLRKNYPSSFETYAVQNLGGDVPIPVFSKIHKKYIDVDTLTYFRLPWQWDNTNSDYIIILQEMNKEETDLIFEHTKRLRKGANLLTDNQEKKTSHTGRKRKNKQQVRSENHTVEMVSFDEERLEGRKARKDFSHSYDKRQSRPDEIIFLESHDNKEGSLFAQEADSGSEYSLDLDEKDKQDKDTEDVLGDASTPTRSGPVLLEKFEFTEIEVFPTKHASSLGSSTKVAASITVSGKSARPPESGTLQALTAKRSSTMFKWLHLKQQLMNFQQFKEFVLGVVNPPVGERKELLQLFEEIQGHEAKRRMNTYLKSSFDKPKQLNSTANAILWLCFPYLSFRRYETAKSPAHASDHPNRTLVQSYEAVSGKDRRLQQALTKYTKSDKCFFVSQLWCLVLNQRIITFQYEQTFNSILICPDTIITCAQSTVTELAGDIIKLIPSLHSFTEGDKTQTQDSPPYLYVQDRGHCVYLLSVERCQSWAEFVSQFVDLEYGSFDIYENSVQATSTNWNELRIAYRAKSTQVFLTLTLRTRAHLDASSHTPFSEALNEESEESSDEGVPGRPNVRGIRRTRERESDRIRSDDVDTSMETAILEDLMRRRHEERRMSGDDIVEVTEEQSSTTSRRSRSNDRASGRPNVREIRQVRVFRSDPGRPNVREIRQVRVFRSDNVDTAGETTIMEDYTPEMGIERRMSGDDIVEVIEEHSGTTSRRSRSNDSGESSRNSSPRPGRIVVDGKTRMPKRLVHKQAIIDLGYPFEEEEYFLVVRLALDQKLIQELVSLSEKYMSPTPAENTGENDRSTESLESVSEEYDSAPLLDPGKLDTLEEIVRESEPEGQKRHESPLKQEKTSSIDGKAVGKLFRVTQSSFLPAMDYVTDLQVFRIFTWMSAVSTPSAASHSPRTASSVGRVDVTKSITGPAVTKTITKIDMEKLDKITHELHMFLSTNRRARERVTYKNCPRLDFSIFQREVFGHQVALYKQEIASADPFTVARMRYTLKMTRSFVNSAGYIFQSFLPPQHDSDIAAKFWGGLNHAVEKLFSESKDLDQYVLFDDTTEHIRSAFESLSKAACKPVELLSDGKGPVPGSFRIPATLSRSFLNVVILLAEFQVNHKWVKKVTDLTAKIDNGNNELFAGFSSGSLSNHEAIVPVGLLSLLVYQLCGDVTYNQEPDLIFDAYQQYLHPLEAETQRNPRDRGHQVELVYVKQELKAIMSIFAEQEQLLQSFSVALGPQGTGWAASLLRIRDRPSIIVDRAKANCNDKLTDLQYLLDQAETILETHSRLIETVKDVHESASLTFAIVSVIFLPLTAVASILGMNTSDVRDMNHNQWVFWAAGLPLAAVTGLFCLWCTAQLDEFGTWARDRWLRSRLHNKLESVWTSVSPSDKYIRDDRSELSTDVEDV